MILNQSAIAVTQIAYFDLMSQCDKMNDLVKKIVMSCHDCQVSRMRLQRLSLEFAEADVNQLPLPRQKYGIDFHGHAKGEILVANHPLAMLPEFLF